MKRFPKIKWSTVAREAIARELEELELLDKLIDKGAISLASIKAEALPVLKRNNVARAAIFGSDINAAINILKRGRAGLARTDARGDICLYPSTGRASSVEELRTYPETFEESFIKASGEAPKDAERVRLTLHSGEPHTL
jgi:hypothetical protein